VNDNHRAARRFIAVVLGLWSVGLTDAVALAQDPAQSLSASFRKAAGRVRPSVVALRPLDGGLPAIPFGPTGPRRFGPMGVLLPMAAPLEDADRRSGCSGVIVDAEHGRILTTDHVLQGASQVLVIFADGRQRVTSRIRRDSRGDLALLVVDPQGLNLTQVQWGDASTLEPGDWVLALGQPGGSAPTMSAGIVSARRRIGGEELIETDAVMVPVNSGGPLINLKGDMVGINKMGGRRQDGLEGMGLVIPADRARRIAADLAQFGQVRRAYIGVQVEPVDPASPTRRDQPVGVVIAGVEAGGPAAEAGLRPGDVLINVGGRPIEGIATLQGLIEFVPIGEELILTIERQGQRSDVKVRPRAMPNLLGPVGLLRQRGPLLETRRDLMRGRFPVRERATPRPTTPARPVAPESAPSTISPARPDGSATPPLETPDGQTEPPPR
jgi:serine protease Do